MERSSFQMFKIDGSVAFVAPIPRRLERVGQSKRAALLWAISEGVGLNDIDLGGAALAGVEFHGASARGVYLYSADLRGANLFGCDLSGACLVGADLSDACLGQTRLRRADLTNADAATADFYRADLIGAKWLTARSWPTRVSGLLDETVIGSGAELDAARDDLVSAARCSMTVLGSLSESLAADQHEERLRSVRELLESLSQSSRTLGYPMGAIKRLIAASPLTGTESPGSAHDTYEAVLQDLMLEASRLARPILGDPGYADAALINSMPDPPRPPVPARSVRVPSEIEHAA